MEDSSNLECVDPTVDLTVIVPAERLKHPNVVEGLVFTKQSTAIESKSIRTMRPAAMVMFGSVISKLIAQGFEPDRLLQITSSVHHTPKGGKEVKPLTLYSIADDKSDYVHKKAMSSRSSVTPLRLLRLWSTYTSPQPTKRNG